MFAIGMLQWIEGRLPATPIEFTYLILTYEAVVRTVAQVLRVPCLSAMVRGNTLRAQYLMLDELGLNAATFIQDTVSVVATEQGRKQAQRCLRIATTARNAAVHGALGGASASTLEALSRALILSVDLLIARALHHMSQEASYFVWLEETRAGREVEPGFARITGEADMLRKLGDEARARRMIPAGARTP